VRIEAMRPLMGVGFAATEDRTVVLSQVVSRVETQSRRCTPVSGTYSPPKVNSVELAMRQG